MRNTARRLNAALFKIDEVYLANESKKTITDAEFCLMYVMDDDKGHSQAEICRECMIPKTTLNTIVKRWEKAGMITMKHLGGTRHEKQLLLTDKGKKYVKDNLDFIYAAEDKALKNVIDTYGADFVDAVEAYGKFLKEAFE